MVKTDVCCSIGRVEMNQERKQFTDWRLKGNAQLTMLFCARAGRKFVIIFKVIVPRKYNKYLNELH